jgi:predicted DsbA family dithiol-disulfide isomerase
VAHLLRLYTDFVCPFCFIAEESTVPRLLRELELELDWHGFELHPGTPRGGLPLSALFPNTDLNALHARTRQFAKSFGVNQINPPDRLQSSRRALAIAEYAKPSGKLPAFRQAALRAHWVAGKNLEDEADLRDICAGVGLDPELSLRAADDATVLARVDEKQAVARAQGIRGIPTFVIGAVSVVGCQPYEALASAAERAGVPRR